MPALVGGVGGGEGGCRRALLSMSVCSCWLLRGIEAVGSIFLLGAVLLTFKDEPAPACRAGGKPRIAPLLKGAVGLDLMVCELLRLDVCRPNRWVTESAAPRDDSFMLDLATKQCCDTRTVSRRA
jgi:hypothetical protein